MVSGNIDIFYNNVDVLTLDKFIELKNIVNEKFPDLIILSEVNSKKLDNIRSSSEFFIDNYETIYSHDGRGMLIYVKMSLKYRSIVMNTKFDEYLCINLKTPENKEVFICSIYRSPSSKEKNNEQLLNLFDEIILRKPNYILIIGDFNLPHIDWSYMSTSKNSSDIHSKFIEKLRDCFFTQLMASNTRVRGSNKASLLDLVITNDVNMIDKINTACPLGRSDHYSVILKLNINPENNSINKVRYLYDKGNYDDMKKYIHENLSNINMTHDIEDIWSQIKFYLNSAVDRYVPKLKILQNNNIKRGFYINMELKRKIKKKKQFMVSY
jgi:hypothetical protein